MKPPITGIVITLNEEKNITECLQSLFPVCDEIIVVDSGSKDKTVEIAEKLGAKVLKQSYLGDGPQKNFGLSYAKNDWVLSLDADERITEEALQWILNFDLSSTPHEGFAFRRRNFIGSRWVKVAGWYPDYFIRLYNKTKTRFSDVPGHSQVTTPKYEKLKVDLIHYSYKNLGELFSKADRFSSRGAKMLYKKGRKSNCLSPYLHGFSALLRKLIFQGGIFGGLDGITISLSAGINSYLKWAKLLELQKDPKVRESMDLEKVW